MYTSGAVQSPGVAELRETVPHSQRAGSTDVHSDNVTVASVGQGLSWRQAWKSKGAEFGQTWGSESDCEVLQGSALFSGTLLRRSPRRLCKAVTQRVLQKDPP